MRTENIKVTFEIPLPTNKPDKNGVIYTKEAWEDAVKNAVGMPIEIINNDGSSTVVGIAQDVELVGNEDDFYIKAVGLLWHGGTCESVEFTDGKVTSMELNCIGIAR